MWIGDYLAEVSRNMPLRRKLLLVVLATLGVALLLISILMVSIDRRAATKSLREEIQVLARVIADRSQAALLFGDKQMAVDNLNALSVKSSIISACMYDEYGTLFARYPDRDTTPEVCDARVGRQPVGFGDGVYIASQTISLDEHAIGVIFIKISMNDINKRTADHVFLMLLIFLAIGVLALNLAETLQRFVTRPIDELLHASRVISRERDYTTRVPQASNDELGQLIYAFNEMLSGIEERDEALVEAKQNLESIVRQRTRALRDAQNELVRSERMATLGQLTATVSHELRNPLATIRTSAFTLSNRIKHLDPSLQKNIERIERNIVRCDNIITELLDFTRIRAMQHERTNLNEWLRGLVDAGEWPASIVFRFEVEPQIEVEVDRNLLRRVIMNVLDNACQAIEDKQTNDRTVIIQSHVDSERTEIIVVDTGEGIDPEVLPYVFEPLYSTRSFGVGLGLAVVKQIMEQHGGGVEIHSEPGVGTQVSLWLPASLTSSRREAS